MVLVDDKKKLVMDLADPQNLSRRGRLRWKTCKKSPNLGREKQAFIKWIL